MASFANEARGLKIKGTDFEYFTEGAYGLIFVDRNKRKIRKIFRVKDAPKSHCEEVFAAEIEAYKLASVVDELKPLIPSDFCVVSDQIVLDKHGVDVSSELHMHLSFETEFVECDFVKLGLIGEPERARITSLFHKHGIQYTTDMSVCVSDGVVSKAIDFATHEIELFWS